MDKEIMWLQYEAEQKKKKELKEKQLKEEILIRNKEMFVRAYFGIKD